MKQIITTFIICFFAIGLYAQDASQDTFDVIVTTQSERMDVKIVEVGSDYVKYKKANNLNGPTFVISTEKIASVMYANGEVQVFKNTPVKNTSAYNGQSDAPQVAPISSNPAITNLRTDPNAPIISTDDGNGLGVGVFMELMGTVNMAKNDFNKVGGSIGGHLMIGMQSKHTFIGLGGGGHGYFFDASKDGVKVKCQWPYFPLFANTKVFFLAKDYDMYLDLSVGGYISAKAECEVSESSLWGSETNKTKRRMHNGFYLAAGLGTTLNGFDLGIGYELKTQKAKIFSDNGDFHSIYFKIGWGTH